MQIRVDRSLICKLRSLSKRRKGDNHQKATTTSNSLLSVCWRLSFNAVNADWGHGREGIVSRTCSKELAILFIWNCSLLWSSDAPSIAWACLCMSSCTPLLICWSGSKVSPWCFDAVSWPSISISNVFWTRSLFLFAKSWTIEVLADTRLWLSEAIKAAFAEDWLQIVITPNGPTGGYSQNSRIVQDAEKPGWLKLLRQLYPKLCKVFCCAKSPVDTLYRFAVWRWSRE